MSDFPPPPPSTDRLASIGQRALAQIIDSVLIGIPLFLVTSVLTGGLTSADGASLLFVTVLWLGVSLFYNTGMIAVYGATIGKRVMKLRVVNRVDGSPVNWTYAAVRALVPTAAGLIPAIGFAVNLVVYLRAVFHPLRQGWHDAAAGTIVVRR